MKILFYTLMSLATVAAKAHESNVPHKHPHEQNMLPGIDLIGVAALILALGVILVMKMRER